MDGVPSEARGAAQLSIHIVASAIGRREVLVATRCQAVEDVNYRVHRLATVATQLPSAIGRREVLVATRCQAVEVVNYRVHRLATVAT